MIISRTKNATRNIFFGIIARIYSLICPFILRTIMIYSLGVEYVGLNGLFISLLQVLNLSELGVGSAMVFSMYKPIAENDTSKICALLYLYKKYYFYIGYFILIIGSLLTPFIPYFVNGKIPDDINIIYIYIINLCSTVLSYWLFAYKNSLIVAHQRLDIIEKISLFSNTFLYLFQILVLIYLKNYYYYVFLLLFHQVFTNIITAFISERLYPYYKATGDLSISEVNQIKGKIKDLFTAKFGGIIQSSSDAIIISSFLGLAILGKYNNYYIILTGVFSFICILFNSILAGIGNSIIVETTEKNYNDFLLLFHLTEWIVTVCASCFICLYQHFISLWVGTDNLLEFPVVIGLVIYFVCITINQMLCVYKDASGIWHQDRYRPLVVALINLFLNLITVKWLGLYGVVLSTVISMSFVGIPWLIYNIFTVVFKKSLKFFAAKFFAYNVSSVFICVINYFFSSSFIGLSWYTFVIKLLTVVFFSNFLFVCFYCKTKEFYNAMLRIKLIAKQRIC